MSDLSTIDLKKKIENLYLKIGVLEKEKDHLTGLMAKIVMRVSSNEDIALKIEKVERSILRVHSFQDLFDIFLSEIKNNFDIQIIKIILVKNNKFTNFILENIDVEILGHYVFLIEDKEFLILTEKKETPILDNENLGVYNFFTAKEESKIKSLAFVPIISSGIIGAICFGSDKKEHYRSDLNTSLLENLGRKFSICLENVFLGEELRKAATYDFLTGILNFREMKNFLEKEFSKAKRHNKVLSLAYIDLDKFKAINDTKGHEAGDLVLKFFANCLEKFTRREDIVARKSGDEFIVIFPETNEEKTKEFFLRLKKYILENPFIYKGEKINVQFSFGIATIPNEFNKIETINDFLKAADDELYKNKNK